MCKEDLVWSRTNTHTHKHTHTNQTQSLHKNQSIKINKKSRGGEGLSKPLPPSNDYQP